ncbi:MAG: ABC transporter ATP-binding protein [candidate division Zixibacteria bacterium CG_4_9_14_3_um_filter_46_8]|nr:MAG: ABC transporter ATP-binding protein [candidate division Zixibacteria bacterium CG_4_9_14_3_um_filter_46_8]
MLEITDLQVRYGAIAAIRGITLCVESGKIVTLLGANGAGKSTTLKTISGLLKSTGGSIRFNGDNITNFPPHKIVAMGISHAPEGRMIFSNLTVKENLEMGAYLRDDRHQLSRELEYVFTLFPRLKERIKQAGGTLSGGEQQMLTIGRALMARPKMLLLDEPSLGIGPILVKAIFDKIVEINHELKMTILLVEQNAHFALKVADFGYVMETGQITMQGTAVELSKNEQVRKAYLGEG